MPPSGGDWKELLKAAGEGNLDLTGFQLRRGIDPNYQHPEFFTNPLFEAIRGGHLDVVKLLVEHGADVRLQEDSTESTPLEVAMESRKHDIVDFLMDRVPDQTVVKYVLITGGNRGIGRAIAFHLLEQGHSVSITCRSEEKGASTIEELKSETGNSKISFVVGDLSSVKATRDLAVQIKKSEAKLNVLIHNAGIWPTTKVVNEDRLEMAFMVNYVAPYILNQTLIPTLKANAPGRIVMVNAGLFLRGKANPKVTPFGDDFHSFRTYASTKQCVVACMLDFAEQLAESGVTINAVHPGVVRTGLGDDSSSWSGYAVRFVKWFWKDPSYGAVSPSWLAVSDDVAGTNGLFYNEKEVLEIPGSVIDEDFREKWRAWTEKFLAQPKPIS